MGVSQMGKIGLVRERERKRDKAPPAAVLIRRPRFKLCEAVLPSGRVRLPDDARRVQPRDPTLRQLVATVRLVVKSTNKNRAIDGKSCRVTYGKKRWLSNRQESIGREMENTAV
jgi:hypothetical protein